MRELGIVLPGIGEAFLSGVGNRGVNVRAAQFFGVNATTAAAKDTFAIPKNATMLCMFISGGGGGGGNGRTGASGTARGGGGGGAAAMMGLFVAPTIFIPQQLWIEVGAGGAAVTAGIATTIGFNPNIASNILVSAGGGGQGGSSAGTGAGTGGAKGATTNGQGIVLRGPLNNSCTCANGGQGGSGTVPGPTGITYPDSASGFGCTTGGGGGGGATTANVAGVGANVNVIGNNLPQVLSIPASPGSPGTPGAAWYFEPMRFFAMGGSGGNAVGASGTGGKGGDGGPGCGGGGGGAGVTGGAGGRGGDGWAFLWCV